MRKIFVMGSVSLDGFVAGPDGDLSWHAITDELHADFNNALRDCSAFIQGRRMHELMTDYWPTADADPDASPTVVEYAGIWREMPKYVYSRSFSDTSWNTTIVRELVADDVRALKEQPGNDMALGGPTLGAEFMRAGLIDEWRLYVHPVVIGAGLRLFTPGIEARLSLIETRTFDNGVVLVRYENAR